MCGRVSIPRTMRKMKKEVGSFLLKKNKTTLAVFKKGIEQLILHICSREGRKLLT